MNNLVYLKPNVVIEPLIQRWYAWSHLISPGTAAMNVSKRHMRIMNSYIENPRLHKEATKNPKMLGGPFSDYAENRDTDIKELLKNTLIDQKKLIELSFAIKKLTVMLQEEAKGQSLESLYEKVPEILKGYVELIYDLNGNPSFRFYEYLLYQSEFYDDRTQSIALWLTNNDSRPFVLSTPRLNEEDVIHLNIPFSSPFIDELSKMKRVPGEYDKIRELVGSLTAEEEILFKNLFTDAPSALYKKYEGDSIRMRYFGHACILIETKEISILIDPLISYYGYQSSVEHFSDFDLPEVIDYVLITHNHQDHILLETLLPLRHKIKKIIVPRSGGGHLQDPSVKLMFENIGFNNIIEIGEFSSVKFLDCEIKGIPFMGEHSDLDIKSKMCYQVKISDFSLLFVADSRIIEKKVYERSKPFIGDIDVIFLGMECDGAPLTWLYGPLVVNEISREHDRSRRLSGSDCNKGMSLVDIFNPSEVYVYAMGQEPWCEFISSIKYTDESNPIIQSDALVKECISRGIIAERLYGEKEILYNKTKNSKKEIESQVEN
ncbi:MBL fold metallo-hydrolase [Chryseobacterium gallinarum]|uniref:MBL fold metallo-hydrolase n=1 Tax=Chryseobacterium gallinarum TaxID=1324352 RepID=UPI00202574C0|nr:MBL fold metallo-hydrolase [Chryseobacterium gallinarum]MCL8537176.1 MBL fold metallo-hydrolase [Chryseobacterium gallinarum]